MRNETAEFDQGEEDAVPLSGLVGELDQMCSLEESTSRAETRQVDRFEMPDTGVPGCVQIDPSKAVKKYQRSSADKKYAPAEIRTVPACWRSVEYLIDRVLDFDVNPKPGFAQACYTASYFDIYSFLRDRLRGVRVDLHLQNVVVDPVFVRVHEICLRFELLSLYLLWGSNVGQTSQDRKFDLHLSLTALSQTIDPLINAYAKRRELANDNEAEMTAYILLLALTSRGGSKTFKSHFARQSWEIQRHPLVQFAYEAGTDFYSCNWASFLQKFASPSTPFLAACAMLPVVNLARTRYLWRMVRTNRPFFIRKDPSSGPMPPPRPERVSLARLQKVLAFGSVGELTSFLTYCGLDASDGVVCQLPPRQLTKNPVSWWMSSREWRERAGDTRDFPEFEWRADLRASFEAQIGTDVGDDQPPARCDFPMQTESVLRMKHDSLRQGRKAIVTGIKGELVGSGLPSSNNIFHAPVPTPPVPAGNPFVFKPAPVAPRPEIPSFLTPTPPVQAAVKPVQPQSIFTQADKGSIFSQPQQTNSLGQAVSSPAPSPGAAGVSGGSIFQTPAPPVRPAAAPVESWAEVGKRGRDSPETSSQQLQHQQVSVGGESTAKPPVKKLQQEEIPPAPMPTLPPVSSGFDFLASQLADMQFESPRNADAGTPLPALMDATPLTVDEEGMNEEELRISQMRSQYVKLKYLRAWFGVRKEKNRWGWLLGGSKRAPSRLV